ncbi:MAG: cobalamin-binding domain-containing protein [Actinobacteria bacterium]|nr:cobalamin-binding domain-containing protein [Actinomycetota bacterium]
MSKTKKSIKILLVEPDYRNKYPPLGLMKIAAFHKQKGHDVRFVKGCDSEIRNLGWDEIYITTLFSFYWNKTIETIKYYLRTPGNPKIYIGGIMASLMQDDIEEATGIRPVFGLLNEKGKLGIDDEEIIDRLVPDYHILEDISYIYPAHDAYFAHTTRGCIRKCEFCAVSIIEPKYVDYIPLKSQIELIDKKFGQKKDLLLMDNNVLASKQFDRIVDEIKDAGFVKGAKLGKRLRYVDFNQGIDPRILTKEKIERLAELPIKPLRIAFDDIELKEIYAEKIRWAAEYGLVYLSNYVLYNFEDTPEDFYERLRINIELNEELGTQIFSFPMKYVPFTSKNRKYIGSNWNYRYLRSVNCILNATHGVVGIKKPFFNRAFGENVEQFKRLLAMPEKYIIYRDQHEATEAKAWVVQYDGLLADQKIVLHGIIDKQKFVDDITGNERLDEVLQHYRRDTESLQQVVLQV